MNNNKNSGSSNGSSNNNENEKKEKKTAEVEKKSSLPILSVGLTWILAALLLKARLRLPSSLFLVAVLSFVVYQIVKKKFPPKKIEIKIEDSKIQKADEILKRADTSKLTPEELELRDINERMDLYVIEIKLLTDSIGDEFISNELFAIEKNLNKIKVHINDGAKSGNLAQSKRIEQLTQFFDYYMPTTIKILNSYRRIEKQGLTGENAAETKKRVEESLPFIKKAFEKELDNLFSDEMLDITTDIDVLESMLSKDGLIDKNNLANARDIKSDIKNDFFN